MLNIIIFIIANLQSIFPAVESINSMTIPVVCVCMCVCLRFTTGNTHTRTHKQSKNYTESAMHVVATGCVQDSTYSCWLKHTEVKAFDAKSFILDSDVIQILFQKCAKSQNCIVLHLQTLEIVTTQILWWVIIGEVVLLLASRRHQGQN